MRRYLRISRRFIQTFPGLNCWTDHAQCRNQPLYCRRLAREGKILASSWSIWFPCTFLATAMRVWKMFRSEVLLFLVLVQVASATLPSPVQCNSTGCTVSYYQSIWLDRTPCKAAAAIYPSTEEELIEAVAYAARTGSKVKVVSQGSHSVTKLVCPGGEDGIIISTRDYNSEILINATALTVTADAGVELRELVDRIAEAGLTLPHTPYWEGVSVAGLISTGAHGSGIWGRGSAPHDYVVGMRLVIPAKEEEGYAKVIELKEGDEDLDAAKLSLGVLGAISKVTLLLEPMFKRSVKLEIRGDESLEDDIEEFARQHEFGGLSWYPASSKALFRSDDRVSLDIEGNGAYKLKTVALMDVHVIEALVSQEEAAEETKNLDLLCATSEWLMQERERSGDGLVNEGTNFTNYPVVGYSHRIQTAGGCQKSVNKAPTVTPTGIELGSDSCTTEQSISSMTATCNWNPLIKGTFFFDTAISIPMTSIREAILEIKKLRDADPKAMCGFAIYGGIWIRFIKASKAYLGERTDSVVFEMMYRRSKKANTARLNEDVIEEIEQMLLSKYGGKPHLGKNRNMAFENLHTRVQNMDKFLATRQKLDPEGLFSSEWSDAILGISAQNVQKLQDHCALEGLCVCVEDSHCHPSEGYYCRPGRVFEEARVCRHEETLSHASL